MIDKQPQLGMAGNSSCDTIVSYALALRYNRFFVQDLLIDQIAPPEDHRAVIDKQPFINQNRCYLIECAVG